MPNIRNLISAKAAAALLGVDVSYVARLIRDGRLAGHKVHDGLRAPYLLDPRDVERFARAREEAAS